MRIMGPAKLGFVPDYLPRLLDRMLVDVVDPDGGLPAVLLVGPRGAGKTTTAERHAASVLRLDRPSERRVVEADPDGALAGERRPLLIDEWQLVPDVLSAVKRAVDSDFAPGQFILTGSSRADLTQSGWAGTGRLVRFVLWGMTEPELAGLGDDAGTFLSVACDPEAPRPEVVDAPDLRGYVERALRGGLPQLARSSSPRRRALLADAYVEQLITRDIEHTGGRKNPDLLRRYLRALAASTAGTPSVERLVEAASIDRATAGAYDDVLDLLMVTQRVPAYASNRLNRLALRPKRFLAEPSLLAPLVGIDERAVVRDADLLGRVIDTYVAAQLRPQLELTVPRPQLFHLRDRNGEHEIDLLVEWPDGSLVAIEIKASAAPSRADARHLRWLRDRIGDRFIRGIVLHTGPRSFQYEPDIWYLPIAALWT
jgi:predicted AAA+ superfamily ATPase